MKTTGAYKIWRIVYPIGIYYVVSSLAYFFLTLLLGAGEESYMLRQMLCAGLPRFRSSGCITGRIALRGRLSMAGAASDRTQSFSALWRARCLREHLLAWLSTT